MEKTTKFLIDVLKRHEKNEVAQQAAMIDLRLVREKLKKAENEVSNWNAIDEISELIRSNKITVDQIL